MLNWIRPQPTGEFSCTSGTVKNFMTVDIECWFHAYNLKRQVPPSTWDNQELRLAEHVQTILRLLRKYEATATFFVLGWVAERCPELVREIEGNGHEIATHGYAHELITEMTPVQFREDLERSLDALARCSKSPVVGYRASNFTIVEETLWALETLSDFGFEYDSSIFPFKRRRYGIADYPARHPHTLVLPDGRSLTELPMSTVNVAKRQVPIAGGGYLRLYPHQITEWYIDSCNRAQLPAIVYFHPWEFDFKQKRLPVGWLQGFQHYVNLNTTERKVSQLLERFGFTSVREGMAQARVKELLEGTVVSLAQIGCRSRQQPPPEAPAVPTVDAVAAQ